MPYVKCSILNPVNLVDLNRALLPNYHWRHFDAWTSYEQQAEFERAKPKAQPVQRDQIMSLQLKSDISPLQLIVRNELGQRVITQTMLQVAAIGLGIFYENQLAFDTPATPGGYYLVEVHAGTPDLIVLQSEVINVRTSHPGTILAAYNNSFNNQILWQTGYSPTFRFTGVIPYDRPNSIRTVYIDQPGSGKTVKGTAARVFKLYVGCDGGDPNYVVDKLDEILDQTDVFFDGKGFAILPGAAWNSKKVDRYPWAGWNIEVIETNNTREKLFTADGLQDKKFTVDYIVETKLFGPIAGTGNNNAIDITEIH